MFLLNRFSAIAFYWNSADEKLLKWIATQKWSRWEIYGFAREKIHTFFVWHTNILKDFLCSVAQLLFFDWMNDQHHQTIREKCCSLARYKIIHKFFHFQAFTNVRKIYKLNEFVISSISLEQTFWLNTICESSLDKNVGILLFKVNILKWIVSIETIQIDWKW